VVNYCYLNSGACPTGAWGGNSSGLIESGNSSWGGLASPSPSAMAFVQRVGQLSQIFTATSSKQVRLVWQEADRPNPNRGGQTYIVAVNGTSVGTYTSSGTGFRQRISDTFSLVSGEPYVITFTGQMNDADRSGLIDSIRLITANDGAIEYSYDALGRLVSKTSIGGVNADATATYCYDAADNRTRVVGKNDGLLGSCP
ncbi:unnamed protein product, partial [Laminaria digitata]